MKVSTKTFLHVEKNQQQEPWLSAHCIAEQYLWHIKNRQVVILREPLFIRGDESRPAIHNTQFVQNGRRSHPWGGANN